MASRSLGPFPKSRRWHEIVRLGGGDFATAETLLCDLRSLYGSYEEDADAQAAIRFLIAVVVGSRSPKPIEAIADQFGIELTGADPAALTNALNELIPAAHAAKITAIRTIATVYAKSKIVALFPANRWDVWRNYDGAPFCDLARTFFAHLNEVVFAEALAGAGLKGDEALIRTFAWEMSLITRTFSARWFNACARYQLPEQGSIDWYLAHCVGKLDLELAREQADWVEPTGNPWKRRKTVAPKLAI